MNWIEVQADRQAPASHSDTRQGTADTLPALTGARDGLMAWAFAQRMAELPCSLNEL